MGLKSLRGKWEESMIKDDPGKHPLRQGERGRYGKERNEERKLRLWGL